MGECLRKFVSIEKDWIPNSLAASLYIRPTFIGLEVLKIIFRITEIPCPMSQGQGIITIGLKKALKNSKNFYTYIDGPLTNKAKYPKLSFTGFKNL